MVPHLVHPELKLVIMTSGICILGIGQTNERKRLSIRWLVMHLHTIDLPLTFTGLQTFGPLVLNIFVAKSSAVLEPSTARSATTGSA